MTDAQRIILISACLLLAVGLGSYFVEYRAEVNGRPIIPLGKHVSEIPVGKIEGLVIPEGVEPLPKVIEIISRRGIYSKQGHSHNAAAAGGIVAPFVLVVAAIFVGFGRTRKSS